MTDDRIEVATGGDPGRAIRAALREIRFGGHGVYRVTVEHDDGCPCATGQWSVRVCTCEVVHVSRERLR